MDITEPVVNFTRLEQLTGYNFRVRAVNQQGPGVPSEVIKAKTEESGKQTNIQLGNCKLSSIYIFCMMSHHIIVS